MRLYGRPRMRCADVDTGKTEAMEEKQKLKLYYSIGEVADMFDLNESTLRFWEKEFPKLDPERGARGVRRYTQGNIEQIRLIHHLVKVQGLTIQGARDRLRVNRTNVSRDAEILQRLTDVRRQLADMRDALDSFTYDQINRLADKLADEDMRQGGSADAE